MLVVKTKLGLSKLNGIGLFADQDITKGTTVWKNNPELSFIKFSQEEWKRRERELSEECFKQIKNYGYKYKKDGNYYLDIDNTRFINHSRNPNLVEDESKNDIAIKDIKKGEEILMDYTSFFDKDYLKDADYL
ncbi:SET domain-containing protein [Patescibacteria group bacterium]|nr:SET domain-containing protein [Patescibacteria group bacterium]MBU2219071.1 SET domain-containing protein [Patescibacteria group bacterium]